MTADTGSFFFAWGATDDDEYYPTDGIGGSATGTVADSHMAGYSTCVLDALQITTSEATGGGTAIVQVKDAAGGLILSLSLVNTANPVGTIIPLNIKIKAAGGFTVDSNIATDIQGVCTYRRIYPTPS